MSDKLVTVDVSLTWVPRSGPFIVRYSILRNKSVGEIEAYAIGHPGVYVFPFATGTVGECPDYSALAPPVEPNMRVPTWQTYVVQPIYIGNLDDHPLVIGKIIDFAFRTADIVELVDDL